MVRAAGEMQREDAARVRGSDRRCVLFDQVPDLLQRRIVAAREVQRKIPEACKLL
jgi:ribosomal protein L14